MNKEEIEEKIEDLRREISEQYREEYNYLTRRLDILNTKFKGYQFYLKAISEENHWPLKIILLINSALIIYLLFVK